tara:strand:+ start:2112 stop:2294 length:183 start_codon:yes stop_codon:yes gene_type:complete
MGKFSNIDIDKQRVIEECDKLREEVEGVGLSDGLLQVVELAFDRGVQSALEAVREEISHV